MSVNLSALISCSFSSENLYRLPELMNRISSHYYSSDWKWYECGAPEPMNIRNFEKLVEEGFLWIEGPNNMSASPRHESIEIGYGWSYSRFFTKEQGVYEFIEFCSDISEELDCFKVYFLADSACEDISYKQLEKLIASGHFTITDESNRLSEYRDHDIYSKNITKPC